MSVSSRVLVKNKVRDEEIAKMISYWKELFPEESFLFEEDMERHRQNLVRTNGMAHNKGAMLTGGCPLRLHVAIAKRYGDDYWDQPGAMKHFYSLYTKARINSND